MTQRTAITRVLGGMEAPASGERFDTLLTRGDLVIERIISAPKTASGPFLQSTDEWVMLLQGHARLDIAGEAVELSAGEAVMIPAQTPHRVIETSEYPHAVWLAIHLRGDKENGRS